jgi:hypothetical protein
MALCVVGLQAFQMEQQQRLICSGDGLLTAF